MIEELIKAIISHPIILSLVGPFIWGGETILVISILAGQGLFKLWIPVLFCALGMWLADLMWFLIGRIKYLSKLKKINFIHKGYIKAKEEIDRSPNDMFLLVLIKFAYGIGIPILMYLGRKKMTLKEFIIKNSLIIFLWSTSIVIGGWIIGKSSAIAMDKFENIYLAIGLIVTGVIILHIIVRQIKKLVHKFEKKKNG